MARGSERTAALVAVAAATIVGFVIRMINFDQSLIADELSTYWIIEGRSLGDILDLVHSDAEITPPVYFVLAWGSTKLGSAPELLRLPSLLAGTACIPMIYLVGARTIGRAGGAMAAALMALSPFMIYFSTDARAYAVMLLLLLVSTFSLLKAVEGGGNRWWILYAACSVLAVLTHYTVIFCLFAQFLWALWAHPAARRGVLLANVGAAIAFLPWITGFIADNNSPTTAILDALQPFTWGAIKFATEQWAAGYPYVALRDSPGNTALVLMVAGAAVALVAIAVGLWRRRGAITGLRGVAAGVSPGVVLVLALALATPVGEAVASIVGTNLYGARNLNASWPGLALTGGAVVAAAPPIAGGIAAALVIAGFSIGAVKTMDGEYSRTQYGLVASAIERDARPSDVVVDASSLTPVPTTGLDVHLPQIHPEYRLNLPVSDMPFMVGDPVPSPVALTQQAFREARGRRLYFVRLLPEGAVTDRVLAALDPQDRRVLEIIANPPPGFRLVRRETWEGIPNLALLVFDGSGAKPSP